MSTLGQLGNTVRKAAIATAAKKAGIELPPEPVTSKVVKASPAPKKTAKQATAGFVEKYKVALILTAVLGVLILIKMRR